MKGNKLFIFLIVTLTIVVIGILGVLAFIITQDSKPVVGNNQNIRMPEIIEGNTEQNNQIDENIQENQNNEMPGNISLVDPIIDVSDPTMQPTEGFVEKYYYNQLDDTAKKIYTELKSNKSKFISGNYSVDYGTKFNTLLNSDGGQDKLMASFQSAWDAFIYDNVDLFYIDVTKVNMNIEYQDIGGIRTYKMSIGPRSNGNYFLDTFQTQEQVEQAVSYIENIRNQMTNQINADDMYTKLVKVHNWLIQTVSYDATLGNQYTIYGAIADKKAVCEGYARTLKYFMDAAEVPCVLVSGTATNSRGEEETHAWNYVQINEKWYAVDVTWDDPIITGGGELTQALKYKYFLKGSTEFNVDHKEDGRISENGKKFTFPTLSEQNYQQ